MKYYHGQLEERNGEQEYSYDYLIKAKSFVEAQARMELEASQFYGSDGEKEGDGYFFESAGIYVEAKCLAQTTKAQFIKDMLQRYEIAA